MRKLVEIVRREVVEVEIDESKIDQKFLDEFSAVMWKVESVDDIIKYAAKNAVVTDKMILKGDNLFIEGIGHSQDIGLIVAFATDSEEIDFVDL